MLQAGYDTGPMAICRCRSHGVVPSTGSARPAAAGIRPSPPTPPAAGPRPPFLMREAEDLFFAPFPVLLPISFLSYLSYRV
ncbi:hypothetical protein MTP99_012449 [Tenebrio molitor]|jgi:hypothetical protein|nr:hypothetical protein MTP99_012449 [Tenebrio molitor]